MGNSDVTLYQILFDLELSICERFPSLSPFDIRKQSAYEVILLIKRMTDYNLRENKIKKRKIRRPAGDDWF